MRIGLTPKSNSKNYKHPDRIYLTDDPDGVKHSFRYTDMGNGDIKRDYIVLEIDSEGLKLYKDPNFSPTGFYTQDNIHSSKIKNLE